MVCIICCSRGPQDPNAVLIASLVLKPSGGRPKMVCFEVNVHTVYCMCNLGVHVHVSLCNAPHHHISIACDLLCCSLQAIPESDIKEILAKNEEELQRKAKFLQVREREGERERGREIKKRREREREREREA